MTFTCPISSEIMKDPVILCDGHTYERAFIQMWLDSGKNTSPNTNMDLKNKILIENKLLKTAITEYQQKK